jgi:hypothetical protein
LSKSATADLDGAGPETTTMHCSGFRVRLPSDKIDFVKFCAWLAPGMTFNVEARIAEP